MKITLCVITLNEEESLGRCLESAANVADEIVVLDSGSTDRTGEVARSFGARFEVGSWPGFVEQKNRVIKLATHEWILSLDADEALSVPLQDEIAVLKSTGDPGAVAGFSMPRCVFYEGRWIRHGDWYPDRLVRLFRKERSRFIGARVHEKLEVDGAIQPLTGDIEHYSFKDSADHYERSAKYARLWAEGEAEKGRSVGPFAPLAHGAFRWFRYYLLRLGFLDGRMGWRIAGINAREARLKYQLLREMRRAGR